MVDVAIVCIVAIVVVEGASVVNAAVGSIIVLGTREGVKGDVKVLITCRLDNGEEMWVPMLV